MLVRLLFFIQLLVVFNHLLLSSIDRAVVFYCGIKIPSALKSISSGADVII